MEGKIYLEGEINESGGVNDVDTMVPIFSIGGGWGGVGIHILAHTVHGAPSHINLG